MCDMEEERMKIIVGKGISAIGILMGKLFKYHKLKCNAFTTK